MFDQFIPFNLPDRNKTSIQFSLLLSLLFRFWYKVKLIDFPEGLYDCNSILFVETVYLIQFINSVETLQEIRCHLFSRLSEDHEKNYIKIKYFQKDHCVMTDGYLSHKPH